MEEPNRATKSIENTVFVRFVPPTSEIRRHHVLDVFSEIGPIKKSSIIHNTNDQEVTTSSYGFIRYTTLEDAALAAVKLNNRVLNINAQRVTVKVELAQKEETHHDGTKKAPPPPKQKTNRLIVRNLSFYATEKDIRKALSKFGELSEVHIPVVPVNGNKSTSRGFAFVMFDDNKAVESCLQASVTIKNRPVQIAHALHKTAYESRKQETKPIESAAEKPSVEREINDDDDASDSSDNDDKSNSSESDASSSDSDDESRNSTNNNAVAEKRCLFLRNLPFDVSRHDIFEAFREYGHIDSIYIVKDKETGKIPRGTAFVTFQTPAQAAKALADSSGESESAITLKGRNIYADLAVDKETATTLSEKKMVMSKDRRNLYLKGEGRVDNTETNRAWDELPETDQLKRQTAWSDKNTKLKSPLFFINPKRLSIRNLAKHVDETQFKQVIVQAVQRGLKKNLVTIEDQIAHWKASGEMTTKEILEAAKTFELPKLDEKNIRDFIPSIHIHRDYLPGGNKKQAPSRGFGFVEFQHHVHALACLRELNNNVRYTADYAAGGNFVTNKQRKPVKRKRDDQEVKAPRLIVEFTVENKAKAKQQEQHRAQQKANFIKQKQRNQEDKKNELKKRKSRGAAQREKKRRQRDVVNPDVDTTTNDKVAESRELEPTVEDRQQEPRRKLKPPRKQRKVDQAEEKFAELVATYKEQVVSIIGGTGDTKKAKDKRWFD